MRRRKKEPDMPYPEAVLQCVVMLQELDKWYRECSLSVTPGSDKSDDDYLNRVGKLWVHQRRVWEDHLSMLMSAGQKPVRSSLMILDDLDDAPLTEDRKAKLAEWFKKIFPHKASVMYEQERCANAVAGAEVPRPENLGRLKKDEFYGRTPTGHDYYYAGVTETRQAILKEIERGE